MQSRNRLCGIFLGLMFAALGVGLFYQSSNQVMMQRVLAARTTWDGLMGIIFAGFINFVRPLVTCFLGFIVYHWTHQMHRAEPLLDADTTFPFDSKRVNAASALLAAPVLPDNRSVSARAI